MSVRHLTPLSTVAGLDAQNTNNFLQLLAVAAKHVPDSTQAVRVVLGDDSAPIQGILPIQYKVAASPLPSLNISNLHSL
jgi:hypothetical protein